MSKKAIMSDTGPIMDPNTLVPDHATDSAATPESSGLTPDYLFYRQRFFKYPLQLTALNLQHTGVWRAILWLLSWLRVSILPHRKPTNLESALRYSVGKYGYREFYKGYVKKISGRDAKAVLLAGLPENRQLITVSVLLKKLSLLHKKTGEWKPLHLKDCNIAVTDASVSAADLEIRNDTTTGNVWVSLHYYSNPPENGWQRPDEDFQQQAVQELEKIGIAAVANVLDVMVERQEIIVADHFNFTLEQLQDKNYDNASLATYVFKNPANRWYVIAAVLLMAVQFTVFKYLYPFAQFINGDSYAYLDSAYRNLDTSTYPIGYPKFLRLFSIFSKSDTLLVTLQYCFLMASLLALVFTLFYFLKPAKPTKIVLFLFVLINPVLLYLSNYVSSDTMFLALSLTWFTLLFWIMYRPTPKLVFWHGVVLFVAFTMRYNALFYPMIAFFGFMLARRRIWLKMAGLVFALLLIGWFVQFNKSKYKALTGISQFSPFTGWQMANNAMYAYRYVDSAQRKPVPKKLQALDQRIREFYDSTRDTRRFPAEMVKASTVYMWTRTAPLQTYMRAQFKNTKDSTNQHKMWASMGPLYNEYGREIIKMYPMQFTEFYLWPNFLKYYTPPVEFLEKYNMGVDSVTEVAKVWFNYKSRKVTTRLKSFKVPILNYYPIMVGVFSVLFLFGCISLVVLGAHKKPIMLKAMLLAFALWSVNMGFSVFASPIALRFQLFPILVSAAFTILVIGYIAEAAFDNKQKETT